MTSIVSIFFSIISSICTLFLCIPQIVLIFNNKSSRGISVYYLFIRVFGNCLIYMSAKEKNLDMLVLIMTGYTILSDIAIYIMVLYGRHCEHDIDEEDEEYSVYLYPYKERNVIIIMLFLLVVCKFINGPIVADILAWIATVLFTFSALPQIYINQKAGNMVNFSMKTMVLRDLSIFTYLLSILFLLNSKTNVLSMLQWIVGMTSNLLIDGVVYIQYYVYRHRHNYEVIN